MKKIKYAFLASLLLTGISTTLVSCEDDDDEVTILSAVAGDYLGAENCAGAVSDYTVSVYNTTDDPGKVWIAHVYGIAPPLKATVSGNTITLPSTPFVYETATAEYNLTASGTGTVVGDSLKFTFEIGGDFSDACTYSGSRAVVLKPAGSTP
ncbi:hypothetical protein HER32_05850 [Hymenobacter sp. BT18]|uniref:hypothetical protein n=1 Tax=Hymenobacter sp. BT18 TaxID=2835648 RepID=UPI00143EC002|nr:hypothetical protein [Hymenobacter sp. BT18]QIX60721.1 hypothetical protein HER32_05850 [Hymenobacter sp. BT18]